MAAKIGKRKGSIRKLVPKTSLNSPYEKFWTPVLGEDMHFILKILLDKFEQLGLKKIEMHPTTSKRRKPKKSKPSEANSKLSEANNKDDPDKGGKSSETETPKKETPEPGWTDKDLRNRLAIGINEVTRALEKNDLCLVIVCKSAKPEMITKHIIELSYSRDIPALQLPRLSENMAPALGLKSVLALGLRKSAEVFHEQVKAILPRVPPLHVPWLLIEGATPKKFMVTEEEDGEDDDPEETEHEKPPSAKKRKLCTAVPVEVKLQGLKVKKIVPNPGKNREKKIRKKLQKKSARDQQKN